MGIDEDRGRSRWISRWGFIRGPSGDGRFQFPFTRDTRSSGQVRRLGVARGPRGAPEGWGEDTGQWADPAGSFQHELNLLLSGRGKWRTQGCSWSSQEARVTTVAQGPQG